MRWVYCHDNRKLPKYNIPVLCLMHRRKGSQVVGSLRVCVVQQDIMTDATQWISIVGNEPTVQPFAYLDTEGQVFDEQFFHNLAALGALPVTPNPKK